MNDNNNYENLKKDIATDVIQKFLLKLHFKKLEMLPKNFDKIDLIETNRKSLLNVNDCCLDDISINFKETRHRT